MLNRAVCAWICALACVVAVTARAQGGATPLDRYFNGLTTLRASFTQTVKDARGKEVDHSAGTLVVLRPGKFRWELRPKTTGESGQLLIADGRNVWFFDRDLEQVTVKPAESGLSSTPAMLLSGGGNVRDNFVVTPDARRDGLEWVRVEPRGSSSDFRRALFGFMQGDLKRMIIDDRLGQTATIDFDSVTRNGSVAPEEVRFTPPAGADVIGTPRQ